MPRQDTMGGRGAPAPPPAGRNAPRPQPRTMRERADALRNLRPFLRLVWRTSPSFTLGTLLLRLPRAVLPVATLFVGRLIIDEVVALVRTPDAPASAGGRYAELFELQAAGYR